MSCLQHCLGAETDRHTFNFYYSFIFLQYMFLFFLMFVLLPKFKEMLGIFMIDSILEIRISCEVEIFHFL